jgi:Uma2 family endonuclease
MLLCAAGSAAAGAGPSARMLASRQSAQPSAIPTPLVTCSKFDREAMTIPGVVIVFEVLSSTTSRTDRIIKPREYAAVPSIRRYVILESTSVGLTVMERDQPNEVWRVTTLTNDDILRMPEISIEIPVVELYEDVTFGDEAAGNT